jgi:hypothetical protein
MFNFWQEGIIPVRKNFVNKKFNWSGTDTEEKFNNNKPSDYTVDSIVYQFNSNGFRTHEIELDSNKDNILCLGCSHTEGVGLQTPWPVVLENRFPTAKVYNFGLQGYSVDGVARTLVNVASLLKPTAVFILWPNFARFETYQTHYNNWIGAYQGGYIKHHGHWDMDKESLDHYDELTCYNRFYQHKLTVHFLANKYNFQLVDIED